MSKVVLYYDPETQTYLTPKQLKIKEIKKMLKDPDKDVITLNDIYKLLMQVLELLKEG
jgi:hypothetical protein